MTDYDASIAMAIWNLCPDISMGGYIENGIPMRHIRGDIFKPFDPVNDLNDCHEMEKRLDVNIESGDSPRYSYARALYSLIPKETQPCRAPAAARAKAFLISMGIWAW